MKKVILIVAAVLGFAVVASAQPRAIGARIGWGAEISYQHTLGANNFLEADLGWGINDFRLGLGYDFSVQLSLDWRPLFTLIPGTGFGWNSFGLGIRYAF